MKWKKKHQKINNKNDFINFINKIKRMEIINNLFNRFTDRRYREARELLDEVDSLPQDLQNIIQNYTDQITHSQRMKQVCKSINETSLGEDFTAYLRGNKLVTYASGNILYDDYHENNYMVNSNIIYIKSLNKDNYKKSIVYYLNLQTNKCRYKYKLFNCPQKNIEEINSQLEFLRTIYEERKMKAL